MGALSRRKGAAYEREITQRMQSIFGEFVRRGIGQERSGSEISDVDGVPHFWVQTKHGKFISIRDAVVQGEEELELSNARLVARGVRPDERWVLAVTRFNGERDIASMRLDDMESLLLEWWTLKSLFVSKGLCLGCGEVAHAGPCAIRTTR